MIELRPHNLKYKIINAGYEDNEGNYHKGESSFSEDLIPCRYEANGKASAVAFEDGRTLVYEYMVYLNKNCREFSLGETIQLFNKGQLIAEKKVKGFHRGQLNAKLWV